MSYSSDPEEKNRDLDSASIASSSASSSQQAKTKKKPWSKFKSSIKTIGEKMSSKPKFTESTESSEQKRVKKNKKHKGNNGGGSGEVNPSSSGEKPREKSPSKGAKGLIKKLSVESLATPYVGYQPSSVSPAKSYAKALYKSGSTSESNLSASDVDTPRKSLTLDKNTKYGLSAQDSPDSGRVSQTMDDSRPPSQVAEERYSSKEATSDFSADSDFTSPQKSAEDVPFDKLVAQTEQFAQSLASPVSEKEKYVDVSEDFIKGETKGLPSKAAVEPSSVTKSEEKVQHVSKDGSKEMTKKEDASKPDKVQDVSKGGSKEMTKKEGASKPDKVQDVSKDGSKEMTKKEGASNPDKVQDVSKDGSKEITKKEDASKPDKVQDVSKGRSKEITKKEGALKPETVQVTTEEVDGRKKVRNKTDITSAEFIQSEQTKAAKDKPTNDTNPAKSEGTRGKKHGDVKTIEETQAKSEDDKTKNVEFSVPENDKENSKDLIPKKTDPKIPTPSSDPKIPTPSSDPKKPTPSTDPKTPTPSSDPKTPTPSSDPKTPTPSSDPKTHTPSSDPKVPTPSSDPKIPTPSSDPKKPTPSTDPKTPTPSSDPKKPTPSSDPKTPTPSSDPKTHTPSSDRKTPTPSTDPKTQTPSSDRKTPTPSSDPKTPTPSTDPNTPIPSQATEKSQEESITTPPKSLDVWSPLTDPPPPGPTMSVEEKLEAFLSAEGWSGPKDIAIPPKDDVSQQPDKRECLYKILVIGELGTGKTSIIKRYVHQFFSQHYRATIGVDFALKVLNWDSNTIIRLQLWDIAGQERFGNMTRVYYKEAVGAFIVFDVTRSATFDAVLKWKQDLDSKVQLADGNPIPCVLLANKCDQQKEGIVNNPSKMEEYCKENNFSGWFETSAKENINIDDAAKTLVTQILQNDKMSQNGRDSARDGSKFPLDGNSEKESKSCAC